MWKAFHSCLPVMTSLMKRGLDVAPVCFQCSEAAETVDHALVGCTRAMMFWSVMLPSVRWETDFGHSFADRCLAAQSQLSEREFILWCVGCWALWNDRNAVRMGRKIPSLAVKCDWVEEFIVSFLQAREQSASLSASGEARSSGIRWARPPEGWSKLNVDASCLIAAQITGTGAIIRDSSGMVLAAMTNSIGVSYSPFIAEALAVLEGLKLALRLNLSSIIVESDCQALVNMINGVSSTLAVDGVWVHDITDMAKNFGNIVFAHVGRGSNVSAHCLARKGLSSGSFLWLDNFPVWLFSSLKDEDPFAVLGPCGLS